MGVDLGEAVRHVEIDDALVAQLVREQHPDLANREVGHRYVFDEHVAVRLGDDWCVNLPTVPGLDKAILDAAPWLPAAAANWTFPAGIPLRLGVPSAAYPFRWQLYHWLPGSTAGVVALDASAAGPLGRALREIHQPAPPDAPISVEAGITLARHRKAWHVATDALRTAIGPSGETIDPGVFADRWERAVDTVVDCVPQWTHGNLNPSTPTEAHRGRCVNASRGTGCSEPSAMPRHPTPSCGASGGLGWTS